MKGKWFLIAVVAAFLTLVSLDLGSSPVHAQAGCPTTGTFGKNVGRDFFVQTVSQLKDVPQSDFAVQALIAWEPYEHTEALWNPLATTWNMGPDCPFNPPHDVQQFPDQATGVTATAKTLNLGYYDAIRAMMALRGFDREGLRKSLGTWGSCSGRSCDPLLDSWQQLYNANQASTPPSASTFTALVFDTSGSMQDLDGGGTVKLTAAIQAGRKLLDVIGLENTAASAAHQVAVIDFSDAATVDAARTSDIAAAKQALSRLVTTGMTAMPKGLRAALDMFPNKATGQAFIILLSDGMPNVGLNDEWDESVARQQVLEQADEAGNRGVCIYTVGFGDPSTWTIDEDFLKQVAARSVCGTYQRAGDAWQLANIYLGLRHASMGQTLLAKTGSIQQDEVVDLGDVQIPANQSMILFTLNWPGSELDPILRDPQGHVVDGTYPGATVSLTDTLASVVIQRPMAGPWNIAAKGVQVPEGTTTYNAVLSVRPSPAGSVSAPPTTASGSMGGLPIAIVTVVLAGAGVLVYSLAVTTRRAYRTAGAAASAPAFLVGAAGSIPVKDRMLIGRSSGCDIRLDDPAASRRHAQIRFAGGRWYIQDLRSHGGVFVNGQRVEATSLKSGDRIRIGKDEFTFG